MDGQLPPPFNRIKTFKVRHYSSSRAVPFAPFLTYERPPSVLIIPSPAKVAREIKSSFSSSSEAEGSGSLKRLDLRSADDTKRTHVRARLINAIAELLVADLVRYFK